MGTVRLISVLDSFSTFNETYDDLKKTPNHKVRENQGGDLRDKVDPQVI